MGERYCQFTIDEDKVFLDFVSNCKVGLGEATLAVPTLYVKIGVQNLTYDKVVGIVFTTDNWTTVQTAYGTCSSTEMNVLLELWKVAATMGSATEVKFAVVHRAAGSEYWDNNFGRNYRVTPSRPQRFRDRPMITRVDELTGSGTPSPDRIDTSNQRLKRTRFTGQLNLHVIYFNTL